MKIKNLIPQLGILSVLVIALTLFLLLFIDSKLLYITLIGAFTTFCVLLPLNALINRKK